MANNTLHLAIILEKGQKLPQSLNFWIGEGEGMSRKNIEECYSIATYQLHALQDHHLAALYAAYKVGEILHWRASTGESATTYRREEGV